MTIQRRMMERKCLFDETTCNVDGHSIVRSLRDFVRGHPGRRCMLHEVDSAYFWPVSIALWADPVRHIRVNFLEFASHARRVETVPGRSFQSPDPSGKRREPPPFQPLPDRFRPFLTGTDRKNSRKWKQYSGRKFSYRLSNIFLPVSVNHILEDPDGSRRRISR